MYPEWRGAAREKLGANVDPQKLQAETKANLAALWHAIRCGV